MIERPSKKDGFCFKLYNPLDLSIWAPRGPENETIGAVVQPLPSSYCIFRASSQASGMCWLDALEISIRNDSALVRSVSNKSATGSANHETQWSEADYEKHFDHGKGLFIYGNNNILENHFSSHYVTTLNEGGFFFRSCLQIWMTSASRIMGRNLVRAMGR